MELLLNIQVRIKRSEYLEGQSKNICMIEFDGTATGPYFNGEVIGTGVDTQKIEKGGCAQLSARYMLEGTDAAGNHCRIFIENNGSDFNNCTPTIYTSSTLLAEWENASLQAKVIPTQDGVLIEIYR